MQADRQIWQAWAQKLHSWGLADLVASLLEVMGPVSWIGAQALYLSQPLFSLPTTRSQIDALADLFEEPEDARTFIDMLRKGTTP